MARETVEVDGAEFDKEALADAVEAFNEQTGEDWYGTGIGISSGLYTIIDDGDADAWVRVAEYPEGFVTDGGGAGVYLFSDLEDAVEDPIEAFAEALEVGGWEIEEQHTGPFGGEKFYITGKGIDIVGEVLADNPLDEIAEECGVEIDHAWVSYEGEPGDLFTSVGPKE